MRDPVDPDTHTPETPESQPARPPQSDPAGWLLGGRYRVVDRLGRGGMAEVFRAHDDLLDRDVAVKVFRTVMDGDADTHGEVRRELELQSLARLSHPNLITLFDGSVAGDGPAYLVLELVHGPDLSSRIKEGPLPEREAREIGAQIADALAYVHARGMVHRDVKPANILLGIDEGLPLPGTIRARLSDFGIVRMIGSSRMTAADLTLGTASYVAPEQARGADVGPPADVYALGLVLIEALTGVRCFDGPIHEALAARLASSPQIPAHLPSPWPELLAAMTAQDPDARPAAAEVTRGLREGVVPDVGAAAPAIAGPAIAGAAIAGAAPAAAAPLDAAPVGAGTTAPISPVAAVVPAAGLAAGAGPAADATGATSAIGAASAGPPPPVVVPAGADWDEAPPPRRRPRRGAMLLLAAAAFAAVLAGAGFLLLGGSGNSPADSTPTLTTGSSSASTSAHKSTVSQAAVVQTTGSATQTDRSSGKTSAHRTATTHASTSTRTAGATTSTSRSTAPAGGGGARTSSSSSPSLPTTSTSPTTPSSTSPNGTGAPAGAVASPIPTP